MTAQLLASTLRVSTPLIFAALVGGWLGDYLLRRMRGSYYLVSAASMALGVPVMVVALFAKGSAMVPAIVAAAFFLLLNTSPLNAAVINSVGAHIRATAIAVNIFIIHILGDVPSPTMMGWVAAIIVLAADRFRHDRILRFHAFQGLYLFVAWLIADHVLGPVFAVRLSTGSFNSVNSSSCSCFGEANPWR